MRARKISTTENMTAACSMLVTILLPTPAHNDLLTQPLVLSACLLAFTHRSAALGKCHTAQLHCTQFHAALAPHRRAVRGFIFLARRRSQIKGKQAKVALVQYVRFGSSTGSPSSPRNLKIPNELSGDNSHMILGLQVGPDPNFSHIHTQPYRMSRRRSWSVLAARIALQMEPSGPVSPACILSFMV